MQRGHIEPLTLARLLKSVRIIAEPWLDSPYYEEAEKWTSHFWDKDGVYRQYFDRLPRHHVLDLAAGHGRHADVAATLADQLCVVDVVAKNIEVCKRRLANYQNVSYFQNDGFSFRPVTDGSVSGIYCYDAMVHFSPDIVKAYLEDTYRVLSPGGGAVYHHSNYPAPLNRHYGQNPHARNHMTQVLFIKLAREAGLEVVDSTVIPWAEDADLDCVTLVRRPA